jgi:hypothetical protein
LACSTISRFTPLAHDALPRIDAASLTFALLTISIGRENILLGDFVMMLL